MNTDNKQNGKRKLKKTTAVLLWWATVSIAVLFIIYIKLKIGFLGFSL
jgi:hypothetical protein